jgi:hypothetical protein
LGARIRPISGIVAARRHLLTWFGGLALSAKAGIATAAFVTMSAGVVIGAPYTPTSAPWLTPTVAPYATAQTPRPLKPSMVEAATPTQSATAGAAESRITQQTGTSAAATQGPNNAEAEISTRPATTMASATAGQTAASVYYKNCSQASKSGAAPITSGQPGYRSGLDPNHNGVACE